MADFLLMALALTAGLWEGGDVAWGEAKVVREIWLMGTRLRVEISGEDVSNPQQVSEKVIREVEAADQLLSTWDPSTEVSRVNQAEPFRPVRISKPLGSLLSEAFEWAHRTHGAFDPAIGALVEAWDLRGFGRTPSAETLDLALRASGPRGFEIHEERQTLGRKSRMALLDTGGFGKGAALRSAARIIRSEGVQAAFLDFGGQIWSGGAANPTRVIHVAHPAQRYLPVASLRIHDVSVATSGASERSVLIDGEPRAHILDPRSGHPVRPWGSVTVVSPDPLTADILSTALYVMGPQEGLAWVEEEAPEVAVLFLSTCSGGLRASWSSSMEEWLTAAPQADRHDPDGLCSPEAPPFLIYRRIP